MWDRSIWIAVGGAIGSLLRFWLSEAAAVVGVTDRTMQRRLNRALLRLMGMLEELRPPERAGAPPGAAPGL